MWSLVALRQRMKKDIAIRFCSAICCLFKHHWETNQKIHPAALSDSAGRLRNHVY
jgi:hypothetical protein